MTACTSSTNGGATRAVPAERFDGRGRTAHVDDNDGQLRSLILARHQGLQSLGQVLTLGVTTCLAASLLLFPALLRWLTRNRPEETTESADEAIDTLAIELPAAQHVLRNQEAEPLLVERKVASIAAAELDPAPPAEPRWASTVATEELPEPAAMFTD